MIRRLGVALAPGLSLLALAACATPSMPPVFSAGSGLGAPAEAAVLAAAGSPPVAGSGVDLQDRAAGLSLAALEGTERWMMATAQAELRPSGAIQHFDCAIGARFAAKPRPALVEAMTRLSAATESLSQRLARAHPRDRPIADPMRQPCQAVTDATRQAPSSWPSSGAAAGAAYAALLAALAPDRAAQSRIVGRELGLSRAICAMNWPADVESGHDMGVAIFASLSSEPDFQVLMQTARMEVADARAEDLSSPGCAAERRLFGPATVAG